MYDGRVRVIPIPPLVSDVAQRVLTLNKLEQRRHLASCIERLNLPAGATVLDFGCGTGLFATTLHDLGLRYGGYDPDAAVVEYARRRYRDLRFVSTLQEAAASAPYDLIVANCCFHHISDADLRAKTLPAIAHLMHRDSVFILIDVLPLDKHASALRRVFNTLEVGDRKRTRQEFDAVLGDHFAIRDQRIRRTSAFSLAVAVNPIYNDLIVYELALRPGGDVATSGE
jgi:SAM-dependent methyltransferase